MFNIFLDRRGCQLLFITCAFLISRSASAQADGESLRGESRKVNDLTAVKLNLPKSLLPALLWADQQGSSFLALEGDTGVLRRISFPDCKVVKSTNLERKCNWMSLSAEGLLVSQTDPDKLCVIDPTTFEVKTKIALCKLKRAVSAPSLSWAVACDQVDFPNQKLYVIDLKKMTAIPWAIPKDLSSKLNLDSPVVTPDGAHVFTLGDWEIVYFRPEHEGAAVRQGRAESVAEEHLIRHSRLPKMSRFSFKGGRLVYEQSAAPTRMATNLDSPWAIVGFSSDSKLVCTPWVDGDDLGAAVCPVANLGEHKFSMRGIWPEAVGFDPKAGCVYAHDPQHDVVVFTLHGVKKAEYLVGQRPGRRWNGGVRQYLVHPDGKKFVMLASDEAYLVAMP
jgi:hypothetical protein